MYFITFFSTEQVNIICFLCRSITSRGAREVGCGGRIQPLVNMCSEGWGLLFVKIH